MSRKDIAIWHPDPSPISISLADLPTLFSVFTMAPGGQLAWLSTYRKESPSKGALVGLLLSGICPELTGSTSSLITYSLCYSF